MTEIPALPFTGLQLKDALEALNEEKVAQGDPALSNARAPLAHKSTHAAGGADALTPGDIGAEAAGAAAAAASSAAAALAAHQQAADAHPGYLTPAEASAAYVAKGDPALSDSRAPLPHKSSHSQGGSDALSPSDIGAAASVHGHAIADVSGLQVALDGKATSAQGNLAETAIQPGNLALSDARVPLIHKASHSTGGTDALTPADIGAEVAGAAAAALLAHQQAADPHSGYLTPVEGDAAYVGKNDPALTNARAPLAHKSSHATGGADALTPADIGAEAAGAAAAVLLSTGQRFDAFQNARQFCVSQQASAADTNHGLNWEKPFRTLGAAVAAANAYRVLAPNDPIAILMTSGRYLEPLLPLRLKTDILITSVMPGGLRSVAVGPAPGQELNSIFALDSGCILSGLRFVGHQATGTSETDSSVGTRAWAVVFNDQANNGQGPYITRSPYIYNCTTETAEDDAGTAGSVSVGDTGAGIQVDGSKVHPNSPIRSMLAYAATQLTLGGIGFHVLNDGYLDLVACFGIFNDTHVLAESGGAVSMTGGGSTQFGRRGLVADGYSPSALFTGQLRVAATQGAETVDVVSLSANRIGTKSRPQVGQLALIGGTVHIILSVLPINSSGVVVAEAAATGYRLSLYRPTGLGLAASQSAGVLVDFRNRSFINAGNHLLTGVGAGCNYNALPFNGGVPDPSLAIIETNFGKVVRTTQDEIGNFSVGDQFKVNGITGSLTLDSSQFDLNNVSGVQFSRNGGLTQVGSPLRELSNNATLLNSLSIYGADTAPTQAAVVAYIQALYGNVNNTSDANKPVSTATQQALDGKVGTSDSKLTDAREWSAATVTQAAAEAGVETTRRAWTVERVWQAIAAWWLGITGTTGRALAGAATAADARTTLGITLPAGAIVGTTDAQIISSKIFGNYKDSVQSLTINGSTYAINCEAGSEALITSAINSNVTINLANTASVTSGTSYSCTLTFTWTGGAITWFSGNSDFAVLKQALPTLVSGSTYKAVIQIMEGKIYYSLTQPYT
jgi:hypothetical protein